MMFLRGSTLLTLIALAVVVFAKRLNKKVAILGEAHGVKLDEVVVHPRLPGAHTTVAATMAAVNAALKSQGEDSVYSQYSCQTVSWDDVSRGTVGGALSSVGANIADTRLWAKNGDLLYTVRSDNWNEKLGSVSAHEVAVVASQPDGSKRPVTLYDFLKETGKYGSYAGLEEDVDLTAPEMDAQVSIRFQTTFLPVADTELASLQFAPEMYSYQTTDDTDPRNLLLLATTQGVSVQQDGSGATRLYYHAIGADGEVARHWFEAERSSHAVGGAQEEDAAEKQSALTRNKATASVIGIRAMGKRFNVLATVQVPLKQTQRPVASQGSYKSLSAMDDSEMMDQGVYQSLSAESFSSAPVMRGVTADEPMTPPVGQANAARVSVGDFVDNWDGLSVSKPQRDDTQHVTVTVVLYNTVAGGIPSEKDVQAAIDDMEELYKACGWSGNRADSGAAFSTDELTVKNVADISAKVQHQPYVDISAVFPTSRADV